MKGLKQFGAMALAAALTITLVAPVTARADSEDSNYGVQENTFYDKDVNKDSTTWTNKATGDSYTQKSGETRDYDAYNKATKSWFGNPKKLQVGVKGFFKFHLYAEAGQSFDGKIKVISGKDIVSVKQLGKTEDEVLPVWDEKAKQYYFTKLDGTKEYVGDLTSDQRYAARRTQYTYSFRLYGKKAGTAKLQYKIDGKKYKINVTVSDDVRPFKAITYAGKSLQLDYNVGATNSNYYAKQSSNKGGNFYTNKKKGKFRVTMNKNYKFVAMYVLKDTDYETKTYTYDKDGYDGSEIERKAVGGIDLNGDGDFLDKINGIYEDDYANMTYTKYTKKSPKIRLNTSFDKVDENNTYYGANKTKPTNYTNKYTGDVAKTTVLLVYKNKLTKGYGLQTITINYRKAVKK